MTNPIQRDPTLLHWIRNKKLEGLRRLAIWLMLSGVLLYIFGEVFAYETEIQAGIWLLLAGIAASITAW